MKTLSVLSLFLTLNVFVTGSVFAQISDYTCNPKGVETNIEYRLKLNHPLEKQATMSSYDRRTKTSKSIRTVDFKKTPKGIFTSFIATDSDQSFYLSFSRKNPSSGEGTLLDEEYNSTMVTCTLTKVTRPKK